MSAPTIGSLCSGYGGLDRAVEQFFGAETAWFSEFDAAPSKILEHRWPGVPNFGDMTKIDWASVPKVDIICGGTPCQDLSAAGRRRGMTEGTRSNLWVQMREAIAVIRPSIVVWENVRGAYSARATSEVELEPGLLGEFTSRPALRALGRVLGDLSDLGFDAEVVGLRAADAGAPHSRFRVFVVAYTDGVGRGARADSPAGREAWGADVIGGHAAAESDYLVGYGSGRPWHGWTEPADGDRRAALSLLPTPAAHDSGNTPEQHLRKKPGRKVVTSLQVMADHGLIPNGGALLPTPSVADGTGGHARRGGERGDELLLPGIAVALDTGTWGPYAESIARWEPVMGRPAPTPTVLSDAYLKMLRKRKAGRDKRPVGMRGSLAPKRNLNARLVEWMMGQPEGWVTDPEIGLTRNEQLKALGNGVVTQQAELALSIAWARIRQAVAA